MREVNNTGKNQKEPTLKKMCTRRCGTLFLGLEHKLHGGSACSFSGQEFKGL